MIIQKKHQLFHVYRIQDAFSKWISEPSIITASMVDFFQRLLMGSVCQFQQFDFDFILCLVMVEDDVDLCWEPYLEKIRRVVFFIDPDNALGLYGFCSKFYQSC